MQMYAIQMYAGYMWIQYKWIDAIWMYVIIFDTNNVYDDANVYNTYSYDTNVYDDKNICNYTKVCDMNVCNTNNVYNHTNICNTNVYDNVCDTNECGIYVMNTIQMNKMIQMWMYAIPMFAMHKYVAYAI
jgi:hypothetical protein